MNSTILILHALATISMCGLIWFVQIVHYPLFSYVGGPFSVRYARGHQRRTSLVVVPLMLTEFLTALVLAISPPDGHSLLTRLGLVLVLGIWTSTALLQVPQHRRLSGGFDATAARHLVLTNWIRTLAWTARALIAIALLLPAAP